MVVKEIKAKSTYSYAHRFIIQVNVEEGKVEGQK